jgi:hypothetical protein
MKRAALAAGTLTAIVLTAALLLTPLEEWNYSTRGSARLVQWSPG